MAHPCYQCGNECHCDGLLIWVDINDDCDGCDACKEDQVEQITELDIGPGIPKGLGNTVRNIGRKHLEDPF